MTAPLKISVRCFARLREITGTDQLIWEIPSGATIGEFRGLLEARFPDILRERLPVLIARNGQYAREEDVIESADELACFPPVSGG